MTPVRKELGHSEIHFKIMFTIVNTIRKEQYRSSEAPSDGGNPRWCCIERAFYLDAANHADPIHRRQSPVLVIQATIGFSYKEQLYSSSQQSKGYDVFMRMFCCTVRYRQGQQEA